MLIYARVGLILTPYTPRTPPGRPPVTYSRAALYFTGAHQPNKYYVFPLYAAGEFRSDTPDTSDFGRAIAKFRARRLRRVGSRAFR